MKYRVINNQHTPKNTRAEYLYNTFCLDRELTPETFVDCVKTAYYKYDAEVYQPSYNKTLKPAFNKFFNSLTNDDGGGVVDIGAGTGESYYLVKGTAYDFTKYYYVEPFKKMINQF